MHNTASISVVIPFYNSIYTIERAINSVLLQTLLPIEIVVVDDKSSKESVCFLKNVFEKFRDKTTVDLILFSMKENVGAGEARNYGWSKSSGNYIAFLDADDSWLRQKLEFQYEFFKNDKDLMLCGHKYIVVKGFSESDTVSFFSNRFDRVQYKIINQNKQLLRNRFATSTVMLRNRLKVRFSKGKRYSEDFLLWSEIVSQKHKSISLDIVLAFYYKPAFGHSGLSSNMYKMYKGELETYTILYKKRYINYYSYLIYTKISLMKYIRRVMFINMHGKR
ncbi:glycosyltransferase family 2 protein [Psychrobacter celer]|uniref:glycosyltransferase family 2 protein n=1 Tax=Psychrobacter celer TaxID=306572 RepID=UPI003FD1C225